MKREQFAHNLSKTKRINKFERTMENIIKVNDILYTSGGYEQTNIYFYRVVKKTKSSLHIAQLGKRETGKTECNDHWIEVVPNTSRVSKNIFMRRYKNGDKYIRINRYEGIGQLWDGKPQLETNKLFGH